MWTFSYRYLAIFKHHRNKKSSKLLTTSEIFSNQVAYTDNAKNYFNIDIVLEENSKNEIFNIVVEMIASIEASWKNKKSLTKEQIFFGSSLKEKLLKLKEI